MRNFDYYQYVNKMDNQFYVGLVQHIIIYIEYTIF